MPMDRLPRKKAAADAAQAAIKAAEAAVQQAEADLKSFSETAAKPRPRPRRQPNVAAKQAALTTAESETKATAMLPLRQPRPSLFAEQIEVLQAELAKAQGEKKAAEEVAAGAKLKAVADACVALLPLRPLRRSCRPAEGVCRRLRHEVPEANGPPSTPVRIRRRAVGSGCAHEKGAGKLSSDHSSH